MIARLQESAVTLHGNLGPGTLVHVCRLAEGGMGRVDLAVRREGTFQRMYAVKRLHPHLASDPEFRAMFLEEARIAGLLRHPNVVGVLDVGEDDRGPFLVMDYVDGLPLNNLIRLARSLGATMPVQVCLRIALEIARGLHAAHELEVDGRPLGLVHRDLSPQNVLVGFDGASRITDFGIAKALGSSTRTATGVIKGKMAYMAPEQLRMEEPDRRCDLFALGVVIYEMLSGQPMTEGTQAERAKKNLEEPPPDIGEVRSDVPDDLVKLLFELLAKNRAERPADARQVVRRLEGVLSGLLAEEEPTDVVDYVDVVAGDVKREQGRVIQAALAAMPARPAAAEPAPRRSRWLVAAAAVAAALGAAAVIAWPRHEAPAEARRQDTAATEAAASPRSTETPPPPPEALAGKPGTTPGTAPAEGAATEPRPASDRRRGKTRPTKRTGDRLPEWVDFER